MTPQWWNLDDIPWHLFDPALVDARVRWVVEATCLVESRADLYSSYVANVLAEDEDAVRTIEQWGGEEARHGHALRAWLALAAPDFDFEKQNHTFRSNVPYYDHDGRSVRGSVENELLCRCVVEALASAYYRAIHDATEEPTLRKVCDLLARDEARHFRMFVKLLERERSNGILQNLWVVYRRVRDLENDQVAFAFHCSKNEDGDTFLPVVYGLYRVEHIDYALRLILRAMNVRVPKRLSRGASAGVWLATRVRSWRLRRTARRRAR